MMTIVWDTSRRLGAVLLAAFIGAMSVGSVNASIQINTGIIVGTVTDPTGAVIPAADVTLTHLELRTAVKVTTDASGNFTTPALRVGPYEIRVQAHGFQTAVRSRVELHVQERLRVDFTLQPGQITDEVVVTETVAVLQTQSADVGAVVEQRRIVDLPLDGRRYSDLILLAAGAIPAPGTGNPREARLNVNGNFSLQNYFALNGVDNNSFSTNAQERSPQVAQPPPDALREFRVQTRTYSAEFGWFQGAVINAEIRSGSNDLHGAAWWFHRNDNLDANDFFANAAGLKKGEFLRNQAGFALGGPIMKDRTFWFADYQALRQRKQITLTGTVPTAAMRQGDFSQRPVLTAPPSFLAVEAPCVTPPNRLNLTATRTDGRPCADPVGVKLASLYPLPNAPGISPFTFIFAPNIPTNNDSFDIRLDHRLSDTDTIFGVYDFFDERALIERGPFPNPLATGGFSATSQVRGQVLALTWDHAFGHNRLNDLRLGFNRIKSVSEPLAPKGSAAGEFGLKNAPTNEFVHGLPWIRVAGYSFLGTSGFRPQFQVSQVYQVLDNFSYIRGSHSYKMGFEYKRLVNNFLDVRAPHGELATPTFYVGDGFANLLLGNINFQQTTTPLVIHNYIDGYMWYIQDEWRARPNLTLTYGVRYEYFTPFLERNRFTTNFDPSGSGRLITAAPTSFPPLQKISGDGIFERALIHPDRNNVAPRVGFAYTPTERIVLRGGFGIFYQVMDRIGSESILQLNPPHVIDVSVTTAANAPPLLQLRDGFLPPPTTVDVTRLQLRTRDFNERSPYSQQVSLGPQFQLARDLAVDVSFVGNYSRKIRKLRNLNQGRIVTPGVGPVVIPYPSFCTTPGQLPCAFIQWLGTDGTGNYNSLQMTVNKRFSRGFSFMAAYTLGKALGNVQDNLSAGLSGGFPVTPQNAHDLRGDYGRMVFDQRHRFVLNFVWELPFGATQPYLTKGVLGKILGDWQLNGIISSTSGAPLTITGPDRSNTGGGHQSRANCLGPAQPAGFRPTLARYFDTSAFAPAAPFTFGTCGVGTLSSWAFTNWDASLFKKIRFTETHYLEFRVEFFNLTNTPQFAGPDTSVTSGNFGRTTSLRNPERAAREIQVGLKLYF
jgi:hypothetical protein